MALLLSSAQLKTESIQLMKSEWSRVKPWLISLFFLSAFNVVLSASFPDLKKPATGDAVVLYGLFAIAFGLVNGLAYIAILRTFAEKLFPGVVRSSFGATLVTLALMGLAKAGIILVGLVLLIIPAIWLGVALQFADKGIIFQNMKPIAALQHSFDLVKGRWWSVWGRLIMGGLWMMLAALVLLICAGLIYAVSWLVGLRSSWNILPSLIMSAFLPVVSMYFLSAWYSLLYKSLVETKPTTAS